MTDGEPQGEAKDTLFTVIGQTRRALTSMGYTGNEIGYQFAQVRRGDALCWRVGVWGGGRGAPRPPAPCCGGPASCRALRGHARLWGCFAP